ncbi:DUF4362 domain-containing protein [Frankia sp. AgB1.9]|uniref:DUF4362 domain-containing protein n=1 Tax=unclassified Frankia TaxID=2632575 RepID=UPI001934919D|nr:MULTISPECIES: DUF4362 domain-containing protein [unclassified Frankia]MBL7486916.1 DUF4362 domain-containing protein [Frankia sp. AgW1.1]MBL7547197.1 DUF4362 domain-containing protein [Frankia sp. AgB1.9]MBL7624011.1 DUF4362 domain-containing protein [Frankia sp. AgB1.8]
MTRNRRFPRVTGGAVAVAASLLGCTGSTGSSDRFDRPPVATRSVIGLDCGTERLSYDAVHAAEPRRCFVQAVVRRQVATFVSVSPTTEGDPISMTLTSDPSGLITVVVDTSQDAFGRGGPPLTTYTCASIDGEPGGSQGLPDYLERHLHGCTSPTPA